VVVVVEDMSIARLIITSFFAHIFANVKFLHFVAFVQQFCLAFLIFSLMLQ
jgi:hypothetical protein